MDFINRLTLLSLYIFRASLANFSVIGDFKTVGSGHRFLTRSGGDLRTCRHRLPLSQTEMPSVGVRYFSRVPLELTACNRKHFLNSLNSYLI